MASSRPWRFEDDDRPSGSVRPLSQADLEAILTHLGDNPDELLAGTSADRPVVAVQVRASVGRRAAQPRRPGGGCGRQSGLPGPAACRGGWPPPLASVSLVESSAACLGPGSGWS